jgi:hypothetical protein
MPVAVPFEVLIDAGTVSDLDGFENVAGGAQNHRWKEPLMLEVGSFLRYTGRAANVAVNAVHNPKPKSGIGIAFLRAGGATTADRPGQFQPEPQIEMMFEDFAIRRLHPVNRTRI